MILKHAATEDTVDTEAKTRFVEDLASVSSVTGVVESAL